VGMFVDATVGSGSGVAVAQAVKSIATSASEKRRGRMTKA
jgi:hypothetical protein